jgi:hypothetical protein
MAEIDDKPEDLSAFQLKVLIPPLLNNPNNYRKEEKGLCSWEIYLWTATLKRSRNSSKHREMWRKSGLGL